MNQTPTTTTPTDAQQYIEVSRNNKSSRFFFVPDSNDSRIWEYDPDILEFYSYVGEWGMFDEMKFLCYGSWITKEQWDRFYKKLSLLDVSISSVAEQLNINTKKPFLFSLPEGNQIYEGNDKCLLVDQQRGPIVSVEVRGVRLPENINTLAKIYPMVPYDPRLSECLQRFMKEIRDTMNQWLNLSINHV